LNEKQFEYNGTQYQLKASIPNAKPKRLEELLVDDNPVPIPNIRPNFANPIKNSNEEYI
jgi:hypothetical protein